MHQDGRVELDVATDQTLERNDAALPSAVALGIMLSPRRNLTRRLVTLESVMLRVAATKRGLVVAVVPEGRDKVPPLLDVKRT